MRMGPLARRGAVALLFTAACGGSRPVYLATGGDGGRFVDNPSSGGSSVRLGESRLRADVCRGVDTRPSYATLTESDLVAFLASQQIAARVERVRPDLVYVEIPEAGQEKPVRLRVAILGSAPAAGRELHDALLEHGKGSWGVHRANLAVLAPIGSPGEIVAYAVRTKLACWGVLTVATGGEAYVVGGGYTEL